MWLVGEVSRKWVWLVGVGGIYGCIDFLILIIIIPTPLVSVLFCSSLLFVHFFKCFSFFISLYKLYILYWEDFAQQYGK